MNNLKDLNIEKELLPLFDYSLNSFARNEIFEVLKAPLNSVNEIVKRQNIFKGLTANNEILKDYSYSVLYLNEVHFFLNEEKVEYLLQKKITYKLFGSKYEKTRYTSRLIQLIIFFYRLQSRYFLRLDLKSFPEEYKPNIKRILEFL